MSSFFEGFDYASTQFPNKNKGEAMRHSMAVPGSHGLQDSKLPSTTLSGQTRRDIEDSVIQSRASGDSSVNYIRQGLSQRKRGKTIETRTRVSYFTGERVPHGQRLLKGMGLTA